MATAAKRARVEPGSELSPLDRFLVWSRDVGLVLNSKVYVSRVGTVSDYGLLTTDDVAEGEVLFTVPRSALLHQDTTSVSSLLEQEKRRLRSSSGWVPLLLSLLHEYTSPGSRWNPYLSLWTDFRSLDQPMFWSKDERDRLLKGTGIPEAVDRDLTNISREYHDVVLPFIRRHGDVWSPDVHTLDLYTQLVAFVMAYSFQEPQEEDEDDDDDDDEEEKTPNPPMMVPMADMLNHVSDHNANLEFTPDSLRMVSVRPIAAGQEVFNTYGQMSNWQLLHMYGFTEPYLSNRNDTADVPVANLRLASIQGAQSEEQRRGVEERWGALQDEGAFVFGLNGCLTDGELHTTLKVLFMSDEEFTSFKENDGWEDDDDDLDEETLSNDGLTSLRVEWRRLIHDAVALTLAAYGNHDDEDEEEEEEQSSRKRRSLQVRLGQKRILNRLMRLTDTR